MSSNYSLYTIPLYLVLSLATHIYAVTTVKAANKGKWDNANPRSTNWATTLQKNVPADVYALYERGESAHKNAQENLPLFAASIIMGNMARLPSSTLNTFAFAMILMRVLYTFL